MSKKPAISFKQLNTSSSSAPGTPFWVKPKTKTNKTYDVLKFIWKWLKMLIFLFFMLMGLWGCFQSMWDPTIATNSEIGQGLEFGFNYGTTGNYAFDLQSSYTGQYNTMSDWTMAYGPFYAFFVWPACWMVLNFMWVTSNWWGGLNALVGILLLLIIIRIFSILVTLKSSFQTEKMTEIQGKVSEINAKYKNVKDMAAKQAKQQEIQALYKKNNIKPLAAFEQMFITLPIFLIVYRVVTILRPMKTTVLFGIWNFALVPTSELFGNFTSLGWTYIFFLALVLASQYFSMKLPQTWAKQRSRNATTVSAKGDKQMKKTKMTQNIFIVVMCVIVSFSATGVGVYWFLNAIFSVGQAYIIHKIIMKKRKTDKKKDSKILNFVFE